MTAPILNILSKNPIIAAVRTDDDLQKALESNAEIIFLLHTTIFNIEEKATKIKQVHKIFFIHFDLMEGIGKDTVAISYLQKKTNCDGIISTRTNSIKYAKECGLFTIQRFFLVDSQAYEAIGKTLHFVKPDCIEIMPGILYPTMGKLLKETTIPVIAGGLIEKKEEIVALLSLGVTGISTGKPELWNL